jgi:hypothetical protein
MSEPTRAQIECTSYGSMRAFPEAETSNSGVKRSRHYVAKRKINVARRRLVDSVTAPLNAAKLLKKKNWDPSLVQELSNAPRKLRDVSPAR